MAASGTPNADVTRHGHGIAAVDTDYVRAGFDAAHLVVEQGRAAFIDSGTRHSVPLLLDALDQLDIDRANVDYVFVTHVHLDHAGGAGDLLDKLPNAQAVLHPRGALHMVDPEKLIAGTLGVYGKKRFRELYGGVTPIDPSRIVVTDDQQQFKLAGRTLECFHTEGHARHHYCISDGDGRAVFTGDSFGVSYRELDTDQGAFIFPSSTPIDFDPVEAHKSVDRILSYGPEAAYLTHYSRVTGLDKLATDLHRGIDRYEALALEHAEQQPREAILASALIYYYGTELQKHGFVGDMHEALSIVDFDVKINAQGLDVWLSRREKQNR